MTNELVLNATPLRTSESYQINDLKISLEIPKAKEFDNVQFKNIEKITFEFGPADKTPIAEISFGETTNTYQKVDINNKALEIDNINNNEVTLKNVSTSNSQIRLTKITIVYVK